MRSLQRSRRAAKIVSPDNRRAASMNPLDLSEAEFRTLAARMTSLAGDYYARLPDARAYPHVSGARTRAAFEEPAPQEGLHGAALDALTEVMDMSRAPTGRFFGYVLGSGDPVAALGDFLASVLNQNVTAWRSAPAAVTIERQVVRWIAGALGCDGMTGSLCGGGSSANLMALAMAREAHLAANECGAQPGIVYASTEVHMSIPKAVALLGLAVSAGGLRGAPISSTRGNWRRLSALPRNW